MNSTIERIIKEKTQILDYYIEGMTYYDIVGIPDKDWQRIKNIKASLEESLSKETANLDKLTSDTNSKIEELQNPEKYTEKQLKKNLEKIEKIKENFNTKSAKISEKIEELKNGLEGIPTKQVSVKKSETIVRATTVKPEYMKYLNEKRESLKKKYGIE